MLPSTSNQNLQCPRCLLWLFPCWAVQRLLQLSTNHRSRWSCLGGWGQHRAPTVSHNWRVGIHLKNPETYLNILYKDVHHCPSQPFHHYGHSRGPGSWLVNISAVLCLHVLRSWTFGWQQNCGCGNLANNQFPNIRLQVFSSFLGKMFLIKQLYCPTNLWTFLFVSAIMTYWSSST